MCAEEDLICSRMNMKEKKKKMKKVIAYDVSNEDAHSIVFNTEMRKTFVKGVLQDMKGFFEMKSDGRVSVAYDDFDVKNHEFGFKLVLSREEGCTKQMFNELSGALVNSINYMFPGDNEEYDLSFCTSRDKVEVELVSNW